MDFKDQLKQLAERIQTLKDQIHTEEATKTSLILPFIQALGYDVFNPMEVIPEMVCDIGTKKGEKIDYCIMKDSEPIILIECKHWGQDLNLHDNQLLRYFHVSKAKFGVLTNGIIYRFYTDLISPNKMDEVPFLECNLLDLKEGVVDELKKFNKSYFDVEQIMSTASELKYLRELRSIIAEKFKSPSPEFVKLLGKQVYPGAFTAKVSEQFSLLIKRAISSHISEIIAGRLKAAVQAEEQEASAVSENEPNESQDSAVEESAESKIVTTEEELEAYQMVRAILAKEIDPRRVYYRDTQSYFTIIIDDNNRKNVCRLLLDSPKNQRLILIDPQTKEQTTYKLENIADLYHYMDKLIEIAKQYM